MANADLSSQIRQSFSRYRFAVAPATLSAVSHRRRLPGPARALAVVAVAVAALVILNAAPWASGPSVAFAGWVPIPTSPDKAFAEAAKTACVFHEASLPQLDLQAQDQRGNAAALLFRRGADMEICLVVRDSAGEIVMASAGYTHLTSPDGNLTLDTTMTEPKTRSGAGMTIAAGRVAGSTRRVDLRLNDGLDVQATVAAGQYIAWWPTDANIVDIAAVDASGAKTDTLTPPAP